MFFHKAINFLNPVQSLLQRKVKSCIIDSEIVAFDVESGKILPFQTLSTRKRKDVDATNIQVQVAVFAFDLLYFNGKSLLDTSLIKRRELLHASVQPDPGHIYLAEYMDTSDAEQIDKFLKVAVENNCEGLMVKTLEDNSTYEPDKRSHNWLKIKKDYLEGVTDTLDLVPIGAYYGKGKRTGVYGAYLLACYDRDNEVFQSICKVSILRKDFCKFNLL
jgi:DNA ligase-1